MGLTNIISYSIKDASGKTASLPYFIPAGGTISGAQGLADVSGPLIDAAIDGIIFKIHLTVELDLPAGIKTTPVNGNRVREGALIDYSANGTVYTWGTYFPSWKNAGFVGDTVNNVTPYSDVITDLNQFVDKYDNALETFLKGERTFRK